MEIEIGNPIHEIITRRYALVSSVIIHNEFKPLSVAMTQAQILTEFQQLTMPQQIDLLQAALDVVRKNLSHSQPGSPNASQRELADAAQRLLADYESDPELTCFTVLDEEPIHAAR